MYNLAFFFLGVKQKKEDEEKVERQKSFLRHNLSGDVSEFKRRIEIWVHEHFSEQLFRRTTFQNSEHTFQNTLFRTQFFRTHLQKVQKIGFYSWYLIFICKAIPRTGLSTKGTPRFAGHAAKRSSCCLYRNHVKCPESERKIDFFAVLLAALRYCPGSTCTAHRCAITSSDMCMCNFSDLWCTSSSCRKVLRRIKSVSGLFGTVAPCETARVVQPAEVVGQASPVDSWG